MGNIMEYFLILGIADYTRLHLYYFLHEREFFIILGLITFVLSLVARKTIAVAIQVVLLSSMWLNSWSAMLFKIFQGTSSNLQLLDTSIVFITAAMQLVMFVLVLGDLKAKLR